MEEEDIENLREQKNFLCMCAHVRMFVRVSENMFARV